MGGNKKRKKDPRKTRGENVLMTKKVLGKNITETRKTEKREKRCEKRITRNTFFSLYHFGKSINGYSQFFL